MANLIEADNWPEGIYQVEEDDPVLGGPAGITNVPPAQLAARSLYQRLRNITPWRSTLSYPALAYVSHGNVTYVSLVPSLGVTPGTDAEKWQRWGHTAQELAQELGDAFDDHVEAQNPHPIYVRNDADQGLALAQKIRALRNVRAAPGGNLTTVTAALSPFALTADMAGIVMVNAAAGPVVLTLPAASAMAGMPLSLEIIRTDSSNNTVTLNRAGADTFIDGSASFLFNGKGICRQFVSDGVSTWLFPSTPLQFDAGTNLATTQFVQRALGNFQRALIVSGVGNFLASDVGGFFVVDTAGNYGLPPIASTSQGASISIQSTVNGVVLSRVGTDQLLVGSAGVNTLTLQTGDSAKFVRIGTYWVLMGGTAAARGSSGDYGASLFANGWHKFPSGLIVQHGVFAGSNSGDTPVSFPRAFTKTLFSVHPTAQASGTGAWAGWNTGTLTGFNGNMWASASVRQAGNAGYLAFGE